MALHSWTKKSMKLLKLAKSVQELLGKSMKSKNTNLAASSQRLGNVKTRRGIFQTDTLSQLLFVMSMIPLTLILRKIEMEEEGEKLIIF